MMVMYLSLLQSHYKLWKCMKYSEMITFFCPKTSWIMNFQGTSLHHFFTIFALGSRLSSPFPCWKAIALRLEPLKAGLPEYEKVLGEQKLGSPVEPSHWHIGEHPHVINWDLDWGCWDEGKMAILCVSIIGFFVWFNWCLVSMRVKQWGV